MKTKELSVAEVEYTAYELAKEFMTWDEPIPAFSSRFPNILESCLKAPFQTFRQKALYRGLVEKAAFLFYQMIKNHPFENGNKRIAVMTLLLFLYENNKWITMSNEKLYKFAVKIAESKPKEAKSIVLYIQEVIKKHLSNPSII